MDTTTGRAALARDPLTGAWSLHSPHRAGRPPEGDTCPFCPDHLHVEVLRDRVGDESGTWRAAAVENKWPFVVPHDPEVPGTHEVLVLSRRHVSLLGELDVGEAEDAGIIVARRLWALRRDWPVVVAYANVGARAGASQPHLHAQVLGLGVEPPALAVEAHSAGSTCVLCRPDGPAEHPELVVAELALPSGDLVAWCPAASAWAWEVRLAPRRHLDALEFDGADLGVALVTIGRALERCGVQEYNVLWHVHPGRHWHVHVIGRTGGPAGMELGAGLWTTDRHPALSAAALRSALAG